MKKVLYTLFAIFVAQMAMAQMVPGEDPIGTIYSYEVKSAGITMTQDLKLIENNGDNFKLEVQQEMPNNLGTMKYTSQHLIQDGMIIQPLAEMEKMLVEQMSKLGQTAEISIEGEPLQIPINGKVGDEIQGNEYTITISMMGITQISEIKIESKKIIAQETITVPAGTYDTLVYEVKGESQMSAMGQTQSAKMLSKFWILPGKGVIKSLVNDGYSGDTILELKSITRP